MTIVKELKNSMEQHTNNENVKRALVSYFLHIHNYGIDDISGATQEAAYDLELSDESEFKIALKKVWNKNIK